MLNIFAIILIASFWLGMNEAASVSPSFPSIKFNHVEDNLWIISGHSTENISAYAVIRKHFIEIVFTVDQQKKRLMNTAEIYNLRANFVARFELEDEAKNIIKLFFPDVNEFYVAVKNAMPRVTIWEKGDAHGSK